MLVALPELAFDALTEERDLAELCVNCVDDRRAFPIAWKPYDL